VYGTFSMDVETLSLSCVLPLEKERSTCLKLLLHLAARIYLLVLVWISRIILSKVKVLGVTSCLWMSDNRDIVYDKTNTSNI
jgi:hypothetical protein